MSFNLTPEGRKTVEDYILKMLGAPVVKVELDPSHLIFVVDEAKEYLNMWVGDKVAERDAQMIRHLVNRGALVQAKVILGRIRSKYEKLSAGGPTQLDGTILLDEANVEVKEWREAVKYFAKYGMSDKEGNGNPAA